ncbi:MAG: ankyrin repeat domain-containing protein [Nostoc sp. ChiSLP01]|nr:ankyrin repeat domain-containing protein [Nostoc sp. CmiSLP01]MDZ8287435.1 ankyrin repeat domain-containing protein [Nostoc sp. ChiSLP01]
MDEQLIAAIESRDTQRVKELLATGANPNAKKGDETAYELARYGPDEIKCALIHAGADDPSLRHSLVWAVMTNRVETVRVLLAKGADVNVSTYSGSPLEEAARVGNAEIVDLLIAAGADVDNGSMLLTPLLKAIEKGNFNIALKLIAAGANPTQTTKYNGVAPITMSAAQGSAAVIRALIAAGADVNILTSSITINSVTIYRQAISAFKATFDTLETIGKGYKNIVQVLVAHQANLQARDCFGRDALCLACINGNLEVVQILIQAGVNINQQDYEGDTPLLMALRNAHIELAKFLIQSGADVNAKNNEHHTPLMEAVQKQEHLELIKMLIESGADVNAVSKDGDTAMTLADLFDHHQVIELLAQYGVEKRRWDEQDKDDEENDSNNDKRWGAELPRSDFSQAAQNPEYQKAVADLGEICGSQPVPMYDDIPGWFKVHVNSKRRSHIKTEDLQQQFLQRGCFVYEPDKYHDAEGPKQLYVLPTTDKYDAIALHQTNGCNCGIGPGYVVQWLRELEAVQPFILTLVAHDTLEGRFLTPIQDPEKLADRMYDFCPDIVDQGCGSVESLAESLRSSDNLFFWWD